MNMYWGIQYFRKYTTYIFKCDLYLYLYSLEFSKLIWPQG